MILSTKTGHGVPAEPVDGQMYVRVPPGQFSLPRGWYMLFLVTNQSAPSDHAYWVNVQ